MPQRCIFIIGIDGASFNVLGRHLREGRMPRLRAFLDSGVHADLRSVCPPVSPAAWASFHTGKAPVKHGVFGFLRYDSEAGTLGFNTSHHIRGRTIWQILSEAGYRVGVVNVPMTYPPPRVNGVTISGFDAPSVAAEFCYPPDLRLRVLSAIPDYLFGPDEIATDRPENLPELIDAGIQEFRQRARLVELLHADDRFDVFMINFQSLDWLLHRSYLYLVGGIESQAREHLLIAAQQLMATLDECVGRVLAVARDYNICLLVSDHGFTRELGIIYPNSVLDEWGHYVRRSPEERAGLVRRTYRGMLHSEWRLLRSIAAAARAWREPPTRTWVQEQRATAGTALDFDVRRTRVAVVASDVYGLLYFNRHLSGPLAGASATELKAERDELANRLRSLPNPVAGTALFQQVLTPPRVDANGRDLGTPDLILVPPPGCKVLCGRSANERWAPMVYFGGFADTRGTHALDGMFAAAGHGVTAAGRVEPLRLVDVAPTVLALVGLPVPDDMDGKVISAVHADGTGVACAAEEEAGRNAGLLASMTESEQRLLEQRLRSLGYLG